MTDHNESSSVIDRKLASTELFGTSDNSTDLRGARINPAGNVGNRGESLSVPDLKLTSAELLAISNNGMNSFGTRINSAENTNPIFSTGERELSHTSNTGSIFNGDSNILQKNNVFLGAINSNSLNSFSCEEIVNVSGVSVNINFEDLFFDSTPINKSPFFSYIFSTSAFKIISNFPFLE